MKFLLKVDRVRLVLACGRALEFDGLAPALRPLTSTESMDIVLFRRYRLELIKLTWDGEEDQAKAPVRGQMTSERRRTAEIRERSDGLRTSDDPP